MGQNHSKRSEQLQLVEYLGTTFNAAVHLVVEEV